MTTTNYLSPEDFKKMVDAIPLVTEYNKSKLHENEQDRIPEPAILQMCLWIQYCHGLRISEVLNLVPNDFDFDRNILTLNKTKTGFKKVKGEKVRKKQFTSIPPDFPKHIIRQIKAYQQLINEDFTIIPFTRQLIWSYVKKASKLAQLQLGEQQEERYIDGGWTHLIRKSRAKLMIELGAPEVMVKVKLRHTFSVTERYTKPDINALIEWERENIAP